MDGFNYSTRVAEQLRQQAKNIRCQSSSANHECHRRQPVEPYRNIRKPNLFSFKRFKAVGAISGHVLVGK